MTQLILEAIAKLRQLTQVDVQNSWLSLSQDISVLSASVNLSSGETAPLNEKGYSVFPAGREVRWFAQKFIIPETLTGYPLTGLTLRLALTWWAENAKVYVNGKLVQEGDLFDSSARILLTEKAIPGDEIFVAIRLVSPGHDIGALMRSRLLYEAKNIPPFHGEINSIDPGFVADELSVLYAYLENFYPDKLEILSRAINLIDWDNVTDAIAFNHSLLNLRQHLFPLAKTLKERTIKMVGHAHLDMAWLWPVSETWEVAQRTFESVLNLQKDFPYLTFCHTTPALYEWIEKHRPDLFSAIQDAVNQESWEVLGGMWVEPEVALISGESVIRQLLYGQQYIAEKFGNITEIAWLPDSFGFSWQLPQLLNHCEINYFVTQKLHWNDTTEFPYGIFWWESPDGTQILSLMSPPNLTGVMDTNPITITNYAVNWEQQTGLKEAIWLPGVGDHGGGPTRSMLEVQECWRKSPFFPNLEFTTASKFFKQLSIHQQQLTLPTWKDELYLEFHRGCYTTHADQKWFQRRCEKVLYEAELFASIVDIIQSRLKKESNYPKARLEEAWKQVLFNQFHDILPGTSIPEVFETANQEWKAALAAGEKIVNEALEAIASYITLPSPPHPNTKPIFVFNSLNWMRSQIVSIPLSLNHGEVYDSDGEKIPSQLSENNSLLFFTKDIPGVGYRLFWLYEYNQTNPVISPLNNSNSKIVPKGGVEGVTSHPETFSIENKYLLVKINPESGNLSRVYDKQNQREVLHGEGNQLQAFEDKGQYWDAWNIDPNYEQHPLPPPELKSVQWREKGKLRSSIRVIRQIGNSEFCQDYILEMDSPILKITTTVNWQEESILVKATFPLNLEADFATYEIACGAIERTTKPQTPAEKAKWEVYAHHWADLTDNSGNYGVSLLNDCKYGYDSQPNQLRLTLLRSPKWPDSQADKGHHTFTYALYPHSNSWQLAKTVYQGYSINVPLRVISSHSATEKTDFLILPPVTQFLDLSAENLILMAFKQSEKDSKSWILRCYECHGEVANLSLNTELETTIVDSVNGLERSLFKMPHYHENWQIQPWKVTSFRLQA